MKTTKTTYKGHEIQVRNDDGLRNALWIDGKFTGDAGFFSLSAALAYGMKTVDEMV